MRQIRGVGWLLVLLAGCAPVGAEFGGGSPSIPADMVPDPSFRARAGERALLYAIQDGSPLDRLPLLKDVTAYDIYVRSVATKDGERLRELEEQGWLHWAAPGTRVLILDTQDRNHTGAHTASQVQVGDDLLKNQTFWVPSDDITRLIHKEPG